MTKSKTKIIKHRISRVARMVAGVSFVTLVVIAVSSLVRATSLETIANKSGIPAAWAVASTSHPATITVPITYWDQRQDDCWNEQVNASGVALTGTAAGKSLYNVNITQPLVEKTKNDPDPETDVRQYLLEDRQFEWGTCKAWASMLGEQLQQGIVQQRLGADGYPVPTYVDAETAFNSGINVLSMNVTGHNPVQPGDNFYRWFHEVDGKSQKVDGRSVTFYQQNGSNIYKYGGQGIFPIDDVSFSDADSTRNKNYGNGAHNFHFTSHLQFAVKVEMNGQERFDFRGDDDVWVFLDGQLVLDIGGLHVPLGGYFEINTDGTVTSHVSTSTSGEIVQTLDLGLEEGEVVNLDFFYAERSTDGSNTMITISDMNWPITADSEMTGEIVEYDAEAGTNIVQYYTSITNRDTVAALDLTHLAVYIDDRAGEEVRTGYLTLTDETLEYSYDQENWSAIGVSAPASGEEGFKLAENLTMAKSGDAGDTIYFRFRAETNAGTGKIAAQANYYTSMRGARGVSYDRVTLAYQEPVEPVEPDDPTDPTEPDPTDPTDPGSTDSDPTDPVDPVTPSDPATSDQNQTIVPTGPSLNTETDHEILDGSSLYLKPLGAQAYVPNTGVIAEKMAAFFEDAFVEVILSQAFILVVLLVFAVSFAVYFKLRRFVVLPAATVRRRVATSRASAKPTAAKATVRKTAKSAKITKANKVTKTTRGKKTTK